MNASKLLRVGPMIIVLQAVTMAWVVLVVGGFYLYGQAQQEKKTRDHIRDVGIFHEQLEQEIEYLKATISQGFQEIDLTLLENKKSQKKEDPRERNAFVALVQLFDEGDREAAMKGARGFQEEFPNSRYRKYLARRKAEMQILGKEVPGQWGIDKWYQGQDEIDLQGNDLVTVIIFWEEWCPHCRDHMPRLQDLFEIFREEGVQVVGLTKISGKSTEEKVQGFLEAHDISFPVAKEDGTVSSHFAVSGVPAAAVYKNGIILWRGHPNSLDKNKLKDWLKG